MRVLLIGNLAYWHVGGFFKNALQALGCQHVAIDPSACQPIHCPRVIRQLAYRAMGRRPLGFREFNRDIMRAAGELQPDIVLIVGTAPVSGSTLRALKEQDGAVLVNYATDDPFNPRTSPQWVKASIPLYDLYLCTKRAIIEDVRAAGCRRAPFIYFAYEPSLHFPDEFASPEEAKRFSSDVVFVGDADRDRYPYFEALVQAIPNLRMHLYGPYWDTHMTVGRYARGLRNPTLAKYARGMAIGRDYRLALRGAKIALCPLRHANRDTHTMRSFELPACGAFTLAERAAEHQELFQEGAEIALYGSPAEMVEKVKYYLDNKAERQRIAEAGYRKVVTGDHSYAHRLQTIMELAGPLVGEQAVAVRVTEATQQMHQIRYRH